MKSIQIYMNCLSYHPVPSSSFSNNKSVCSVSLMSRPVFILHNPWHYFVDVVAEWDMYKWRCYFDLDRQAKPKMEQWVFLNCRLETPIYIFLFLALCVPPLVSFFFSTRAFHCHYFAVWPGILQLLMFVPAFWSFFSAFPHLGFRWNLLTSQDPCMWIGIEPCHDVVTSSDLEYSVQIF